MKRTVISLALTFSLACPTWLAAQTSRDSADARRPVETFYQALNTHDFERAPDYSAPDWESIRFSGGRLRGRDAVLADMKRAHATIVKDVTVTIEQLDVRFASPTVAIVTVTAHASKFTGPDGVTHENERRIRAFVVAKRADKWLIVLDQSTTITRNE